MSSPQLLERREYKYLVSEAVATRIRQVAAQVCQLDENAGPDGTYPIRSLYLDNSRRDLYWANTHEAPRRFKARVRCYPDRRGVAFLEIKRRILDVIVKTRAPVDEARWVDLALRPTPEELGRRAVREFATETTRHHLEPACLVEYDREAWVSEIDSYGRLTLDGGIRCQEMNDWSLEADPRRWRLVDHPLRTHTQEPIYVLELKFERRVPGWMWALVQRLDLMRFSFSKYCYSVEALFLPNPSLSGRAGTRGLR